jgi:hypothetical protein
MGEAGYRTDAGIRANDVEVTKLRNRLSQNPAQRLVVSDVNSPEHDLAAQIPNLTGSLVKVSFPGTAVAGLGKVGADIDRDNVSAFPGQPYRVASALAPRGARHERDLALHPAIHPRFTSRGRTSC